MDTGVHFSSASAEWETPQVFFDKLNEELQFTLDPCCTKETAKCPKFYTKEDNGLDQCWAGEVVFMNPPYGREISAWIKKAREESELATIVALLPARTDTKWFHNYIYNHPNTVIKFIKGRLKFNGHRNSAPFPSMLVYF